MARCFACGVWKSAATGRCGDCGAAPTRLSDLDFDEVSFVPSGANQDAHIELWKSEAVPVPIWQQSEGLAALARTYADDWEPVAKESDPPMDAPGAGVETPTAEVIAKMVVENPDVYDEDVGRFAKADSAPVEVQKGLDGLAASMVEQGQAATREQAIAKTLQHEPGLYDAMYVPDPGPVELVKHDVNPVRGQDIGPQWVFKDDIAAAEQREDARKERQAALFRRYYGSSTATPWED
jgi:hypothetical protein